MDTSIKHIFLLPSIFDWEYYLTVNPDLIKNGVSTKEQAIDHWINYGKIENRKAIDLDFDWEYYLVQNPYLLKMGVNNKINAIDHWNKIGKIEGRCAKDNEFDWEFYLVKNPDLFMSGIRTKGSAILHWINNGKREGRCGIDKEFDWEYYLVKNPDLVRAGINTKSKTIDHWIKNGKQEGRIAIDNEFNWEMYLTLNSDLLISGIDTKLKAINHWINEGKCKGRIAKNDGSLINNTNTEFSFDWVFYLLFNPDLKLNGIKTQKQCFDHWISDGKREGRISSIQYLKNRYCNEINYPKQLHSTIDCKKIILVSDEENESINEYDVYNITIYNNPLFKRFEKTFTLDRYESFILVIDFPCYGGGTSTFINQIISKYKQNTTFLMARNFNGHVYFYINDNLLFGNKFTNEESIQVLKNNVNKISKIFINSIIGHTPDFLNSLFELGKHVSVITHDYSLLFKSSQIYYSQLNTQLEPSCFDIKKCNTIITQNECNLYIYQKYITDSQVVISTLPDYKKRQTKIETNNEKTVIGVIGYVSDIKGYYLISTLIDICKRDNSVEIIIFGKMNIDYDKQYTYSSIEELNNLFIKHKPNIFIETSLWPETYSYTLTLAMITDLPIFYQKKQFKSVIENRLSSYSKAFVFDNIENIDMNYFIREKQNYFYTIEPVLYFNNFWNSYFSNNVDTPAPLDFPLKYNIVFISSKIYTSTIGFNYVNTRSIYSSKERFHQTIDTIQSVRQYIPNSYIILFDNSKFNDYEYNLLKCSTNIFINTLNDGTLNEYTNVKQSKFYGELAQTVKTIRYIRNHLVALNIQNFFKISGRYLVNETFDYTKYDNDNNIFKRNIYVLDRKYFYTSFYKIGKSYLETFFDKIESLYMKSIGNKFYDNKEWEVMLPELLQFEFKTIDCLGITENIAVWQQHTRI
jgi:hypothetical protein